MIVVSIVGIIAGFAYPSYMDQVKKSRRTEGMAALLELADRMERHYADSGSYSQADGSDMTAAVIYHNHSENAYYLLSIDPGTDELQFTARATPTAKGRQDTDKCGTFIINAQGLTSVSGGSLSRSDCWK